MMGLRKGLQRAYRDDGRLSGVKKVNKGLIRDRRGREEGDEREEGRNMMGKTDDW